MIDIYQERIVKYQEKIYQNLVKIREVLENMPQEIKSLYGVFDRDFLSNMQNKLDNHLNRVENLSTKLEEASHINDKTRITQL